MITQADINKMKEVFATKEDINKMKEVFVTKFVTKDDLKLIISDLMDYINSVNEGTKNEIIEVIGKDIKKLRSEIRPLLHNHEARITHLEQNAFA